MSHTVKRFAFGSYSTNIVLCTVSSKRKLQKKDSEAYINVLVKVVRWRASSGDHILN